ncbi:glycosyltransferase N-terminal domain-containing protein [Sulfitobacter aestuariivivens]|uniref:3-deoxy-D-manno-octulosonic acid transferase n=1 Tax=Sulfitobacter aestuariivivens TaxID=2766981 RepID=A0A927D5G5_9RHOB|nr:3-deoxy-D-manno-octulosonic acid transferase [Sulfitobacter aestuariivivens]
MARPLLYSAWVAASIALVPFFARREIAKLRTAGVSVERAQEKLGYPTAERSRGGPLIWFHGASVGESLSVLALIRRMGEILPRAQFLMTSVTATSAKLVGNRLPSRTIHQFAPLDAPGATKRFLRHWRPDAALFVESELWPQLLRRTHEGGARMALINARLSKGSVSQWKKFPSVSKYMLDVFDIILTQNTAMAGTMKDLGAPSDRIRPGVNLKSMSDPLPVDTSTLTTMRDALANRPVWVASSTHPGEEETVLEAHKALLKTQPDLRLILAPRHPERGTQVADLIDRSGLTHSQRSTGGAPGPQVYLADTLGELGTWYALTDIVFLGGSLRPIGGHNPFEVAQAGAFALSGTHVTNFAETFDEMQVAGAARLVADTADLTTQIGNLLSNDQDRAMACKAAKAYSASKEDQLDQIAQQLITALELSP